MLTSICAHPVSDEWDTGRVGADCLACYSPSEIVAFLLPIYDLINANKAFSSFLLHDRANATSQGESPIFFVPPRIAPAKCAKSVESDILASLISFSSYLGTHAAVGRRAQLYSRLTYTILLILVEEGGPSVFMPAEQGSSIRICRQVCPPRRALTGAGKLIRKPPN